MPRKPTPRSSEYPFHIVARSNNQDWFQLPMPICWEIFTQNIIKTQKDYNFETHAFVMMSNHYHWLASTPQANLGEGMCRFQTGVSQDMAKHTGRINHIFGARYRPSMITNSIYYANVYRYIYRNPLRARLCRYVQDYPWSTLQTTKIALVHPIFFGQSLPKDNLLSWLNEAQGEKADLFIHNALKRSVFKFPRDEKTKMKITGKEFL